ncbi:MAG: diacylglycerol/lipid kinase family protein, partial [Vicinamibacterales bacterium]
ELARQFARDGARTILCVGGDGTANEVVNGLIAGEGPINPNTRLALLPCGTGKDLARTLGTRDLASMLRALADGSVAMLDVGRAQYVDGRTGQLATRHFANIADAGIGAATAARINASSKRFGGLASYLTGAVRSIAAYQPWQAIVEVDGETVHDGPVGMIVFANGRYFAGGMRVAPEASPRDGRLDIFILADVGKRALLTSLLPRVYLGRHIGRPGVAWRRGVHATVRSSETLLLELDGEQVGQTPVTVDILPRVLPVIANSDALARWEG